MAECPALDWYPFQDIPSLLGCYSLWYHSGTSPAKTVNKINCLAPTNDIQNKMLSTFLLKTKLYVLICCLGIMKLWFAILQCTPFLTYRLAVCCGIVKHSNMQLGLQTIRVKLWLKQNQILRFLTNFLSLTNNVWCEVLPQDCVDFSLIISSASIIILFIPHDQYHWRTLHDFTPD